MADSKKFFRNFAFVADINPSVSYQLDLGVLDGIDQNY